MRNAVYSGSWVSDAKRYFSRNGCAAYGIGSDYIKGSPIRQEYLETAIKWISKGKIEDYMSKHQHDQNANALWIYFQSVITWVEGTFTVKRVKFMKGVDWGVLYNEYKDEICDTKKIEAETARLILDDDVIKKSGIYPYILTRDEKQKGICVACKKHFDISEMEGDHITPWHENGKTIEENCQMLCKDDNRRKSGK